MAATRGVKTEDGIVTVATRLFYEKGYHATTMRNIAAGLNIQAGSLYNHFASKQDLLLRICYDTTRALYEGAVPRVEAETDPEARMRALIVWHVQFHANDRLAALVADEQLTQLEPRNRRKVQKYRDLHEQLLRSLLTEGRKKLKWQVKDDAVITFGIATMCTQVDTWYREDGRLAPSEIAEIFSDFILRGLSGS
jgi:AcrR family transcriptional regulator